MLYDQFGRPIETPKKPETRVLAAAEIRDRYSEYPSSGLTPGRLAQILKSADTGDVRAQAELFEEMEEKDAHLFSQIQTRKLAVLGLDWAVAAGEESQKGEDIAAFCEDALMRLDFDSVMLDLLDAIGKGYALSELMWDQSAGQTELSAVNWVHPKRVTFINTMMPRVITDDHIDGMELPPWKFVYNRYKARSGYDTRAGIFRVCAYMYLFKNFGIKDLTAYCEICGIPLRLGKYDPGASQEDKDALLTAVRSLGSDAAGIISRSTEIQFIDAVRMGSVNLFETLIGLCDAQMSKAIVGQTLTADNGQGTGSYALGNVHAQVRQDLIEADASALSRTVTMQILRPLVGYNFGWDASMPEFELQYESPENLKAVADTYKVLTDIGFPFSAEHVSERFKVPMLQDGETPLGSAPAHAGNRNDVAKIPLKWYFAKKSGLQPVTYAEIEKIMDEAGRESVSVMEPMLKPVLNLIQNAASMEEIGEKLYTTYPDMDSDDFQNLLARAMFKAGVGGYCASKTEGV